MLFRLRHLLVDYGPILPTERCSESVTDMASTTLSKIKILSKLGKIFKPREAPANPQPKAKHASAPEPDSKAPTTTSLAKIPTPVANIPEPAALTVETSDQSKISLWDRAYDSLRQKDKKLVEGYEQLLSRELQTTTNPNNGIHFDDTWQAPLLIIVADPDLPVLGHKNEDESLAKTENQINSNDHKIRLAQLETITSSGLQQLNEKKAKYNIFGREFILRDQLAQATQFIQNIKVVIDDAVKTSPEASLAWAGVCIILPIFMNPSAAEEASRDGCLYVTSRIRFYVKLESLLSASNRLQDSGLNTELEDRLITLYQLIIDFQIRTVRRVYLTRLARLKEDTVWHEDWKGMIARIQESEKMFSDDFKLVKDVSVGTALEKLNSNAEKLFADLDFMLASLLKNSRSAPTFSFQNEGSGIQFNATGGTQNNITGNSVQFSGVIFGAPVKFNKN